jgi:hypothetical protein
MISATAAAAPADGPLKSAEKLGHGEGRFDLQDGELSGRGDEDGRRQQREADDEQDGGGDVEAAKD